MPTTDGTDFRTWSKATNTDDIFPIPFGFVIQHLVELIPAHFTNRTGKVVVLHHARRIERFQTNRIVLLDYRSGYFVQEVLTLVGNFLVQLGNYLFLLCSIGRAFYFTGKAPLFYPQAFQGRRKETVIG